MDLQCIVVFPTPEVESKYRHIIEKTWIDDLYRYYSGDRLKILFVIGSTHPTVTADAFTSSTFTADAANVDDMIRTHIETVRVKTPLISTLLVMGIKQVVRTETHKQGQILAIPYNVYPNLYQILTAGCKNKISNMFFPYISRTTNFTKKIIKDLVRNPPRGLKNLNNGTTHHDLGAITNQLYWTINRDSMSGLYQYLHTIFHQQYGNYLFECTNVTPVQAIDSGNIEGTPSIGDLVTHISNPCDGRKVINEPMLLQTTRAHALGNSLDEYEGAVIIQKAPTGLISTTAFEPLYWAKCEGWTKQICDAMIMKATTASDLTKTLYRVEDKDVFLTSM